MGQEKKAHGWQIGADWNSDSGCIHTIIRLLFWLVFYVIGLGCHLAKGAVPPLNVISLPPFILSGQAARAHTQGLELVGGNIYVTARREDIRPRRALLLRTSATRTNWDVWDITPAIGEEGSAMDHPGGMQSDGKRLWIPVAESRRQGRSVIRVFALAKLVADALVTPEMEFNVGDHIGAIAVDSVRGIVLGASWDTETVYAWNLQGYLMRTLRKDELEPRGLGWNIARADSGLAVQDWKFVGSHLVASGLERISNSKPSPVRSRLVEFRSFLNPDVERRFHELPAPPDLVMSSEGMTIADGSIFLLPEDLGGTNRLFQAGPLPQWR